MDQTNEREISSHRQRFFNRRSGVRLNEVLPCLFAVALFALVCRHTLSFWRYEFSCPGSYYEYAPFVPIQVALLLWRGRAQLANTPKAPFYPALPFLCFALLLQVYASTLEMEALMSLSLILSVWCAVWFMTGTSFLRATAAPLAFLLLMAPLPGPLLNDATHGLQQLSTAGAGRLLAAVGLDNVQSGYRIRMDDFTLFVDVPCSGLKTLLGLVTFDAFFALMLDGSIGKRIALFLLSLPLAIAVNIVRIALIGIAGECISDHAAHVFHDYSGLLTLLLGFGVLHGMARLLKCRTFAGLVLFS